MEIIIQHISATHNEILWYFMFMGGYVQSTLHTILNVVKNGRA
jgi:hypothetical protein